MDVGVWKYINPKSSNGTYAETGWVRGTPIAFLSTGIGHWAAVMFRDEQGWHWFRKGKPPGANLSPPEFYGPYATEEEAQSAASVMHRMGELK